VIIDFINSLFSCIHLLSVFLIRVWIHSWSIRVAIPFTFGIHRPVFVVRERIHFWARAIVRAFLCWFRHYLEIGRLRLRLGWSSRLVVLHAIHVYTTIRSYQLSDCTWVKDLIRKLFKFLNIFLEYVQNVHGCGWCLRNIELHWGNGTANSVLLYQGVVLIKHLFIFETLLQWFYWFFNSFI